MGSLADTDKTEGLPDIEPEAAFPGVGKVVEVVHSHIAFVAGEPVGPEPVVERMDKTLPPEKAGNN